MTDKIKKKNQVIQNQRKTEIHNFRWFSQLNVIADQQILLNHQCVLCQLLQKNQYFDIYLGLKLKCHTKVIVRIFDKEAYKQDLKQYKLKNIDERYEQRMKKIKIQDYIQLKINKTTSKLFLIQTHQIIQNDSYHIRISQNYYGESLEQIIKNRISFSLNQALAIIKQIIIQLAQFHKQGIILTYLNPKYIFHKNGLFKISDISSMKKNSQKFIHNLSINQSDPTIENIIAPQLIICPQVIDIKSQIWAIGILLYYLISHKVPYDQRQGHISKQAKSHNIVFEMRKGQASQQVLSFIKQLMIVNPQQRMSWKSLVNHKIFENSEYFSSIKYTPIVDARDITLKKKQNDVIIEWSQNINQSYDCYSQILNQNKKWVQNRQLFVEIDRNNKLKLNRHLDIQSETYFHIKMFNLKALKINYIYEQILLKIAKYKLIDQKRRSHVETMFLICQRGYLNIKKFQNIKNIAVDKRIQNYIEQTKFLINKIRALFDQYRMKLKKLDKSTFYISNDILSSVLKRSRLSQRDHFLKGIQQVDYTSDQHIKFTQQKYINKILPQMKGQYTLIEYVKLNMKYYDKIYAITLQQIQGCKTFEEIVSDIINEQENIAKNNKNQLYKQQKQVKQASSKKQVKQAKQESSKKQGSQNKKKQKQKQKI